MSLGEIRETKSADIEMLLDMLSMYNRFKQNNSRNQEKNKEKPNRVYL